MIAYLKMEAMNDELANIHSETAIVYVVYM